MREEKARLYHPSLVTRQFALTPHPFNRTSFPAVLMFKAA
jgi:hypothetical protein